MDERSGSRRLRTLVVLTKPDLVDMGAENLVTLSFH